MYQTSDWKQLEQWIETPQKKPNPDVPEVEILLIGEYRVTGSTGHVYQVVFGITEHHNVFAVCTCKGGLHRRACRHIRAAWPVHNELAEITNKRSKKS